MSLVAYCPVALDGRADVPGNLSGESTYYVHCPAEWSSTPSEHGVACGGESVGLGPPGEFYGDWGTYYIACDEAFTAVGGGDGGSSGLEDFDPAVAGLMFSKGFALLFAFWALGKVPALVVRLLR